MLIIVKVLMLLVVNEYAIDIVITVVGQIAECDKSGEEESDAVGALVSGATEGRNLPAGHSV